VGVSARKEKPQPVTQRLKKTSKRSWPSGAKVGAETQKGQREKKETKIKKAPQKKKNQGKPSEIAKAIAFSERLGAQANGGNLKGKDVKSRRLSGERSKTLQKEGDLVGNAPEGHRIWNQ